MEKKQLTNILAYIPGKENFIMGLHLEVTTNFSINVEKNLIRALSLNDKPSDELNSQTAKQFSFLPVVDSIKNFLEDLSDYYHTINAYLALNAVNYTTDQDGSILIEFIWQKKVRGIPEIVCNFITEHDESEATLQSVAEDDNSVKTLYNVG
jgi:hypothetical protein|nr:MAG TPA: hypothetical protein [Caudoviricetes sp.]